MPTIQISVSDSEKKRIDHLFKEMGLTTSSATKVFYKQALLENGFPFTPNAGKSYAKAITPRIADDGSLILPDNAPDFIKDWVENG